MPHSHRRPGMPNLFVVGAAKAGTTTIHDLLGSHPEIFMSSLKEPNYFADVSRRLETKHLTPQLARSDYKKLFSKASTEPWVGESSCAYLYDQEASTRIMSESPDAQIIVLLRDPVARAYSHFNMDVREGLQNLPFLEAITADSRHVERVWSGEAHLYVDLGLYNQQVKRYLDTFGRSRVLVLDFADLTNPKYLTERLQKFLRLTQPFKPTTGLSTLNTYRKPRSNLARAISGSRRTRVMAQRALPRPVRRFARDVLLTRTEKAPPIEPDAVASLDELFRPDLHELRTLLDATIPRPEAALAALRSN